MAQSAQTPELLDLTIDNITPNTIRINNQGENERLKYLLDRLVTHLHDFARETRLSTDEWMTALLFLTKAGQICSDVRQVGSLSFWMPPNTPLLKHGPIETAAADWPCLCAGRNSSSYPISLACRS